MAHHTNPELLNDVLQLLTDQGHDGFAEGLRLLVNEAMRVERQHVLQAQPYERTDTRKGYANGFKPKTLASRLGPITFRVPQEGQGEGNFEPVAFPACRVRTLAAGAGDGVSLSRRPPLGRGLG